MSSAAVGAAKSRMPLILIALVCLAPVVAAYVAYHFFPRDAHTNYGELLVIAPAPPVTGTTIDGRPFALSDLAGHWVVLTASSGHCDAVCERALYATRQSRTMQGRERDRVTRLWLVTDDAAPAPAVIADHPDLMVVRARTGVLAAWPHGDTSIYLVDPLGNEVLAWPREPDIKALANDLTKLLRASRIG